MLQEYELVNPDQLLGIDRLWDIAFFSEGAAPSILAQEYLNAIYSVRTVVDLILRRTSSSCSPALRSRVRTPT